MVSPAERDQLVYNIRLSSVGPGHATGSDGVRELGGLDLAMKLHYLKGVYFFSSQAAEGLTIKHIKESTFFWLNDYYVVCGRVKRTESGRPYIKCNDCGVRFVEALCDKTIDEWLEMGDDDDSLHNLLIYHRAIGPELSFSPSLYLQVTRFKCGGISLGISWAHFLGDAFSASDFINCWGQFMAKIKQYGPLTLPKPLPKQGDPAQLAKEDPLSAKRVNPVGDLWVTANNCKMETFSFYLTKLQLSNLQAKISGGGDGRISRKISPFDYVCAVIWQCIAKVREGFEAQTVTVCRKNPNHEQNVPSNSQIISAIKADFSVIEADLKMLALLLADGNNQRPDERNKIEAAMEKDGGVTDYVFYGANLTFVNLEDASLYELELKGQKPKFTYYSIQGVGDEGAVLFLPGPPKDSDTEHNIDGNERLITITLPEDQVLKLKIELKKNGLLLANELE